jgi:hypothetical protein
MCGIRAMSGEDEFCIRPDRIRSSSSERAQPFIAQVLATAQKAGGSYFAGKGKVRGSCGAAAPLLVVLALGSPDLRISAAVR